MDRSCVAPTTSNRYFSPRSYATNKEDLDMAKKKKAKKAREVVVVGSKVKDVVRSAGFRSDGELVQAVSEKVHDMLEAALARTESNKRGTVRPHDL
ncbi:MAG: hypothetical protein V3V08_25975 [Nannocystaceae bacterium]